ncbi:unnamed protein product [Mesocestoides corti]|uniref:Uncharacterized protein n=1 Tax=Mesocestoides corti TaxID=53468 RepID=A0A0R3U3P4_MESCO|nr:unnamed protein product [Mesocestoides corti]
MLSKRDNKAYSLPITSAGLSDTSGSSPAAPTLDYHQKAPSAAVAAVANVFACYTGAASSAHGPDGLDGLLRPPVTINSNSNHPNDLSTVGGALGAEEDEEEDDCLAAPQPPNLTNDYSTVDSCTGALSFGRFGQSHHDEPPNYPSDTKLFALLPPSQQQHQTRLPDIGGPPEVCLLKSEGEVIGEEHEEGCCSDKNQDAKQSSGGRRDTDGINEHPGTPLMVRPASALASTDGHFTGSDFDPRSHLCCRSSLLKVPTAKNHSHVIHSTPFAPQESSRCASAAGGYVNSPFNNPHPRHASGSAAYLRGHLMVVPPDGGGSGGGGGSYLSDSDLQNSSQHIGSVSSSPGIRTESISPTTSTHDALLAHSRPPHHLAPHPHAPSHPPPPDLLFCPTSSAGADFFSPVRSDPEGPLQLRKSSTVNYSVGVDGTPTVWDGGRLPDQRSGGGGSVLTPVIDEYPQHQQHVPSSPMSFSMRDSAAGSGANNGGESCGESGSTPTCAGGVPRRCAPQMPVGSFPSQSDFPLTENFSHFVPFDTVNSITGSLSSSPPSLPVPLKRCRRH